jgi:hypothetical protein
MYAIPHIDTQEYAHKYTNIQIHNAIENPERLFS